ncbi:hypothetical protein [Acetobacter thailandicus]|nr:hypothetical protein [Acetobacter thailandicus]MBS0981015.1 hypothetical protein [Acetobacter thailandicus]
MHAIPSSSDLSGMLSAKHRENSLKKIFLSEEYVEKEGSFPLIIPGSM